MLVEGEGVEEVEEEERRKSNSKKRGKRKIGLDCSYSFYNGVLLFIPSLPSILLIISTAYYNAMVYEQVKSIPKPSVLSVHIIV